MLMSCGRVAGAHYACAVSLPMSGRARFVQWRRGQAATPLWLRIPMQLLFIAWAWAVG
jgi:hypothetical protein